MVYGGSFQGWTFIVVAAICAFGVSEQMFGYTVRPERALVVVWFLCIPLLAHRFRLRKESLLLLLWLALGLFSSLLSADPKLSIRGWVDLSMAVAFFFVCQTAPLRLLILRPMKALMLLTVILGAGAILTAIVHVLGLDSVGSIWSSYVLDEGDIFRIKMMLLEPNLFGIAMAVFSLLSIAEFNKSKRQTWFPLVLAHAGLILAFSRGPILGYMLGLIVYTIVVKAKRSYLKWVVTLVTAIVVWSAVSDDAFKAFDQYFNRQGTIESRFIGMNLAKSDVLEAPLIGNGIYSFSFLHPELSAMLGANEEEKAWIGNLPLLVLHDTGLLGLLLLYSFFVLIIIRGYKATKLMRGKSEQQYIRRSGAWLGATVSVVVASLTTPAYSLSLFWGTFAVCHCIPVVVRMLKGSALQGRENTPPLSSS